MKPKRVDPFTGVINFMKVLSQGGFDGEGAITTSFHENTIIVDTCLTADTGYFETGIKREHIEGEWVIVEQYPNKEAADTGHAKWVKLMTEYPDHPLKDIDLWNLANLGVTN